MSYDANILLLVVHVGMDPDSRSQEKKKFGPKHDSIRSVERVLQRADRRTQLNLPAVEKHGVELANRSLAAAGGADQQQGLEVAEASAG